MPLTKLGLRLGESLDSYTKTIFIPSATLWGIFYLGWRRRNKVWIFAADIQIMRTLAIFWTQINSVQINPLVNKSNTKVLVSKNQPIFTLVVWHTLIPKLFCIVRTIFIFRVDICTFNIKNIVINFLFF